jgi:outer membrane protein assembly factor BamB
VSIAGPRRTARTTTAVFHRRRHWSPGATAVTLRNQRGTVATLFGIDAATGGRRWVFAGRHKVGPASAAFPGGDFPPAVVGGLVHFATGSSLYALDASTGRRRWVRHRLKGSTAEALRNGGWPLLIGDSICLVNGGAPGVASMWALNVADGRVRWSLTSPAPVDGPAAASGDTVYCAESGGHLYALDVRTGKPRWTLDTRKATVNPPTVAGGVVYAIACLTEDPSEPIDYLYALPA